LPRRNGRPARFAGPVWYYGGDPDVFRQALRLGLLWLTQVGAERSTGFGRVLGARVDPEQEPSDASALDDGVQALELTIRPLGPLCVSRHKIGGNLFESEEFIPGNMLAGALIETANALDPARRSWPALRQCVDRLIFRHAFPSLEDGPRPASSASAGALLCDVAELRGPCLLADETGGWQAPAFCMDWKPATWGAAEDRLGWVHPARELRVRTGIDSEQRTGDKGDPGTGGALFAWEMVHPWTEATGANEPRPLVWRGRIELGRITDPAQRQAVARDLAGLLPQLGFVSKTKTACAVTTGPATPLDPPDLEPGATCALVLRTPALLADPRFQAVQGLGEGGGARSPVEMLACYRAAFDELAAGSLALSHHFARQFLAGGNHLAIRFQLKEGRR
jgi:hypothetical protein